MSGLQWLGFALVSLIGGFLLAMDVEPEELVFPVLVVAAGLLGILLLTGVLA